MIVQILVCALAAAGLLLLVWSVAGIFLFPILEHSTVTVYPVRDSCRSLERYVRGFMWLRKSGLTDGQLILVDCNMGPENRLRAAALCKEFCGVLVCTEQELPNILKLES